MYKLIILFYTLPASVLLREIPSFVHLCRRNDPELSKCFTNSVLRIIPYLEKGIPEMNLPSIEPLTVETIRVSTGHGTAINLDGELTDGKMSGLSGVIIPKLEASLNPPNISAVIIIPRIYSTTNYKTKGKVILFEVDSVGHCELNATDVLLDVTWYGHKYSEKGKEYIQLDGIDYKNVELKNVILQCEDFDEERQKFMKIVNNAINDNMDSLITELDVIIKTTMERIFLDFYGRVFKLFSYDQLFPEN